MLDAGELDLPLPGSGQTANRWRKLAAFAEIDVVAARLAEAHADATAILAELGAHSPKPGELWAVWAAESAEVTLTVDEVDGVAEPTAPRPGARVPGCAQTPLSPRTAQTESAACTPWTFGARTSPR